MLHKEDFKKFVNERCEQEERSLLAHDSLNRPMFKPLPKSLHPIVGHCFSLAFSIELEWKKMNKKTDALSGFRCKMQTQPPWPGRSKYSVCTEGVVQGVEQQNCDRAMLPRNRLNQSSLPPCLRYDPKLPTTTLRKPLQQLERLGQLSTSLQGTMLLCMARWWKDCGAAGKPEVVLHHRCKYAQTYSNPLL